MATRIPVFTCEDDQEGHAIGAAHIRQAATGRRVLRVELVALPVDGALCIPVEEVLLLAGERAVEDAPAGAVLH